MAIIQNFFVNEIAGQKKRSMFTAEQLEDFKEAFRLFIEPQKNHTDSSSNNQVETISTESFCTLIRAIGFCPSQAELQALLSDLGALRGLEKNTSGVVVEDITFDEFITILARKLSSLNTATATKVEQSVDQTTDLAATSGGANAADIHLTSSGSLFQLSETDKEALSSQLLEAFKVFDPQNTQHIDSKELYKLLTTLGEKLSEKEAEQLLREADPSNSGKVHYPSLVKLLTSL